MRTRHLIGSLLLIGVIAGCGEKRAPDLPQPQAEGAIGQAQLDALKKAENVDALSRDNAEKLRSVDAQ